MSFWTTFHFVRPGPAATVTTGQLAAYLRRFRTEAAPSETVSSARVIFGCRVGRDVRPIDEERVTKIGTVLISTHAARPLDIEANSYGEALTALTRIDRRVYRAEFVLGDVDSIPCVPVEANDRGLWLGTCGLEVGPITICGLEDSQPTQVGWLGFSIGGPGYSWPRPTHEIRADIERTPAVQAAMRICRELWPMVPSSPKPSLQDARRDLGKLWPYEGVDQPKDWSWFVSESG